MFEKDFINNFWDGNTKHVFGRIYKRYTPYKNHLYTCFWITKEKRQKNFLRITNNFFIEI